MTSSKPYLLRALYEWILDNDTTPYILVDATYEGIVIPSGIANDDVTSRIRETLDGSTIFVECAPWGITNAPSIENAPVASAIPTLILAGEYDPITPPAWGRAAAETLSNSQFFEFPGASHGVFSSQGEIGNCVQGMVEGFLVNSEAPVDGGCVADLQLAFSVK